MASNEESLEEALLVFRLSTVAGDNLSKTALHRLRKMRLQNAEPFERILCVTMWSKQLGITWCPIECLCCRLRVCRTLTWKTYTPTEYSFTCIWPCPLKLVGGMSGAIKTQSQLMSTKTINGIRKKKTWWMALVAQRRQQRNSAQI